MEPPEINQKNVDKRLKLYNVLAASYDICLLLQLYLPPVSLLSLSLATGVRQVLPHKGINITLITKILAGRKKSILPSTILKALTENRVLVYSSYLSYLMYQHPTVLHQKIPIPVRPEHISSQAENLRRPGIQLLSVRVGGTPMAGGYPTTEKSLLKLESQYSNVRLCDTVFPLAGMALEEILQSMAGHDEMSTWVIADGHIWFVRGKLGIDEWTERKAKYRSRSSCHIRDHIDGLWINEFSVASVNSMQTETEEVRWAKWIKIPVYVED